MPVVQHPKIVVMGVSGSGKSTVGAAISEKLGSSYVDGDDLHPKSNIDKMAKGIPLDDADRSPWLKLVGTQLALSDEGKVLGCSALKRDYRDIIRKFAGSNILFLVLDGTPETLEKRMQDRDGHFMPASLLKSQLALIEYPDADENSITVDIDQSVEMIVSEALLKINEHQKAVSASMAANAAFAT